MNKYKKDDELSYSFGAFPTYELLTNKTQFVEKLLISEKLTLSPDIEKILNFAKQNNIAIEKSDKQINKIADKDNIYIVGVFRKYKEEINPNKSQILLVNPSDMGNLGTIIRTMAGFNICDLAIISPCADIFNPKTIRASMGAIFKIKIKIYERFEDYKKQNPNHSMYPFMLKGTTSLQSLTDQNKNSPFCLIFGNEATGLDDSYLNVGKSIIINHSKNIDSLNLPISVSMALYEFTKQNFLTKK